MRLGKFFLLATIATAQQAPVPTSAESQCSTSAPKLPVIDYAPCPYRPHWKVEQKAQMYSSWRDKRIAIGVLKMGERVTVLAGVNMTRKPNRVSVTPLPDL
jgi:hypothetical protein